MIKIVALNDDEEVGDSEQDEFVATKEAQEAIAESEYVRAIKLKAEGNTEAALSLLNELLDTQVINEEHHNNKMIFIKYNCHKNIGLILEDKKEYEMALHHYISAILIDSTDIYTLHKFAQLALKLNSVDLAEYAFEKCLASNALHWKAADGLLMSLNYNCNLIRLYNHARELCTSDPKHKAAYEMVLDILTWFKSNSSVLNMTNSSAHDFPRNNNNTCESHLKRVYKNVMGGGIQPSNDILSCDVNLQSMQIDNLNWRSIGQFILQFHQYLQTNGISLFFQFEFKDVMKTESSKDADNCNADSVLQENEDNKDMQEVSNSTTTPLGGGGVDTNKITVENASESQPMDSNNDDSDSNAKVEGGIETTKNKARRRCSDLHFLEQWGWHKNRRYSSRKKADKEEPDDSLNSYLRRTFSKYMQEIPASSWPFGENSTEKENNVNADRQCTKCANPPTEDEFHTDTLSVFEEFLNNLKSTKTDLMEIIFKWLKSVSSFWNISLPQSIKTLYTEIFELYMSYFDLPTANQLAALDFMSSYRICLLFLELTACEELFEDPKWKNIFYHLCFNIGSSKGKGRNSTDVDHFEIRLTYIKYLLCAASSDYPGCLTCLDEIEILLGGQSNTPEFVLHLPHSGGYCLQLDLVGNMKSQYKSQMDICSLRVLYDKQQWPQLVDVITRNVEITANNFENEYWLKDTQTIFEILLQALWKLASYETCLLWCEKCFHYSVGIFLDETRPSLSRQKMMSTFINYVTSYIEAIILNVGRDIVATLANENLCRMVQNLIRLVVYQFDGNFEKNNSHGKDLDFKPLWSILHQLALRDEEMRDEGKSAEEADDLVPASFQILFTAHEYLGRRHWCSNDNGEFLQYILDAVVTNLKAPIYDGCRDVMYEYIEQVTYCLFQYPPRKARSKYLEDHEAEPVKLNWSRAVQIFDIYKPEQLPEFNSYKLESITSDMEQMLMKIVGLVPREVDPSQSTFKVINYIEGLSSEHPSQIEDDFEFPYKLKNLYYLLADYNFKSRDFTKAIKFYTLDLVINPSRFDSWAGVALSKASQIETKLNGLDQINLDALWKECEQVIRCFECCITLDRFQTLLWIEYGSFCYTLQSFFSRHLRGTKSAEKGSPLDEVVAERKLKLLNIAHNCFTTTNSIQNSVGDDAHTSADSNDEKWLCQYMLGKISEKRQEDPSTYINNYLLAANYLYESNATYPIKVNHSNPTSLSVEALEVFYRINASIIKYIVTRENIVSRNHGDLFKKVLKKLANSPFALNKAKIDGSSLNIIKGKVSSSDNQGSTQIKDTPVGGGGGSGTLQVTETRSNAPTEIMPILSRSSSISTVTISSESSSDSDDSDAVDATMKNKTANPNTYSLNEIKRIYEMVVRNIEECITRFPEHYKSIYRLVYHFMNGPTELRNLEVAEQLLMGQYKTSLGNIVNGLFYEKKHTNLFNGIWRIPSSEIDRPGSFSAHLVKCVRILILLLLKTNNHKILIDISLNLHKTPDADKRYIADADRKELCQLCITYCVEILRNVLDENRKGQRNDQQLLNLLVDIYKIHKKCIKYMNQKESLFTKLLVDVYKFFIEDKVKNVPENCNFLDLAVKLCLQQLTIQKSAEANPSSSTSLVGAMATRPFNIPGLNMISSATKPVNNLTKLNLPNFAQSEFNPSGFEMNTPPVAPHPYIPLEFTPFLENRTADLLLLQELVIDDTGFYSSNH
ncbi:calcineurin-binding protein cabin-1-like [Musca vetustissima]|uniref:calcineurin-binding protein cabin-1-like n=1 Tax=Musca vetustissima TaxID=27455 RepID=UPI002AB7B243|nr:calcineurin-binding protein cabin-1-like [Musca vetustissima]